MSLNSTPRTWVTGEVVSAAQMNAEIRDAVTGVQAAWTAYTPTWTAATTNPVLGNGSIDAATQRIGKNLLLAISLTMGSTTTYGSGQWRLTLPVAPKSRRWVFNLETYDASAALGVGGRAVWNNTLSVLELWIPGTTAGGYDRAIIAGAPFVYNNGDVLTIDGVCELA